MGREGEKEILRSYIHHFKVGNNGGSVEGGRENGNKHEETKGNR